MKNNYNKLILCVIFIAGLCVVQIVNNNLIILGYLGAFLLFVGWNCLHNFSFPILLFFLPWAPLLKNGAETTSFYTLGMVLICVICLIQKNYKCNPYQIVVVLFLLIITLSVKLICGYSIENSYIMFMGLIFMFPLVKEELNCEQYDFKQCIIFFCIGIISAAILSKRLSLYSGIAQYITVVTMKSITRLSGFYGDPNFYAAHITAAIAGCLLLFIDVKNRKEYFWLSILIVLLLYCGMLSGSKSFVIIVCVVVALWVIEVMFMNKKIIYKLAIITCIILVGLIIIKSVEFNELIELQMKRFANADNVSALTTGRSDLWSTYLNEIKQDIRLLLVGEGFTYILIGGRASHNTLIQLVYQLGIIGGTTIVVWIMLFFNSRSKVFTINKKNIIKTLILLVGIFSPWLALDMLYSDEFFLMLMLFYIGRNYIKETEVNKMHY